MDIKKKFKSLSYVLVLSSILSSCGFSSQSISNSSNSEKTISISSEESSCSREISSENSEIVEVDFTKELYDYITNYKVDYELKDYLMSGSEYDEFKLMVDSTCSCTYVNDKDVDYYIERIKENSLKYISDNPDKGYICPLCLNEDFWSYYDSLSEEEQSDYLSTVFYSERALKNVITNLIDNVYTNNTNEYLHRMLDLCVVFDNSKHYNSEVDEITFGLYEDNVIFVNASLIIEYVRAVNDEYDGLYDLKDVFNSTFVHEVNHNRQDNCSCRSSQEYFIFTYSPKKAEYSFLCESSAGSALYDETGSPLFDKGNSCEKAKTYFAEIGRERLLLMMTVTDNNTTLDDYYNAIYDNDWNKMFKFFNLNTDDERLEFVHILELFDALFLRNDIPFEITGKERGVDTICTNDIRDYVECDLYTEIFRMSLRNIASYVDNNSSSISATDALALEKLMLYDAYYYISISDYTKEDFERIDELDLKYNQYIKMKYSLSDEEIDKCIEDSFVIADDMVYEGRHGYKRHHSDTYDSELLTKFPKLETLAGGLSDSTGYKKVLGKE